MRSSRPALIGATAMLTGIGLLAASCAKTEDKAAPGATTVTVTITDEGCSPSPASVAAGPVTFKVVNKDSSKVSEAELLKDESIIGEKENLSPGLSGSFSLKLDAGKYQMYCPNANTEKFDFTVTGSATSAAAADPAVKNDLDAAVAGYKQYVIDEVAKLAPATKQFTDAVRAGDMAKAKSLYAPARYYYEEVEPVAESFGDLDPDVDARIDDVSDVSQWTGFHRLEKALWADKSLAGMSPIADKLDADVNKLKGLVANATYQPAQMANGATELLNEVGSSKITGEEDRYSHSDMSDFRANIDGAKKAFELLAPALQKVDPELATTVTTRFSELDKAIAPYPATIDYSTVNDAARKALTQSVDALADPLSQVAAKVNF
jgi:iron uptake system component EfeO